MLKIQELRGFLDLAQADNPQITGTLTTASEDRYARYSRTIKHVDDDVYLIALLPGARPVTDDEDNVRFMNNLSFMVIRKLDQRAGDVEYEEAFAISQTAAMQLVRFIIEKRQQFPAHCIFRYFDLSTLQILPVENFHETNGWDVSISLKTSF